MFVAAIVGSPHMQPISSIFGMLLCKKMSVDHRPRLLQLGTHQHKEGNLLWFSLAHLNFPLAEHVASRKQTDYGHLNCGQRPFEMNNNLPL